MQDNQGVDIDLDFVIGMSAADTSSKTAFFLKDQNVLVPSGRQLFIFDSHLFESEKVNTDFPKHDQHLINISYECDNWFKRNTNAIFSEGYCDKKKTFFVFNLKVCKKDDNTSIPEATKNNTLTDVNAECTSPIVMYLDCFGLENKNDFVTNMNSNFDMKPNEFSDSASCFSMNGSNLFGNKVKNFVPK